MLASKNVIWSTEKYSLIDLLHSSHSSKYPLLVKVIKGHNAGARVDKDYPGETFVFYGWGKQERVLATNDDNISISIPTSHEHKLSVNTYDAEKTRHRALLPLSSIVSLYAPPVRAEFDPSVTSMFDVGNTLYSSNDFGSTLLKSSHLLEYVKCSPISQAGELILDALHVFPTSESLTCVVARSLCKGLHLGKALRAVQRKCQFLIDTAVDHKLPGVCGYSDLVPQKDGDYELLEDILVGPWGSTPGCKPSKRSHMLRCDSATATQDLPQLQNPASTSADIAPKPPRLTYKESRASSKKTEDQSHISNSPQPTGSTTEESPLAEYQNDRGISPPRTVPKGLDAVKGRSGGFKEELDQKLKKINAGTVRAIGSSGEQLPTGFPHCPPVNTSPTRDQRQPPPTPKKPIMPRTPGHQDPTLFPDQSPLSTFMGTMAHGASPPQALNSSEGKRRRGISSLEDVPVDISSLSVQDVCDCLRLLKLDSYVQQFTENLVDGRLLLTCTADDLQTEFGLTSFRANQVERFAKEGWRPKMNG